MSAGMSLAKAGRRLIGTAAIFFGLVLLSGCDPDPYPADLRYPLRTDLLVIGDYKEDIPSPEPLGSVDTMIDRIQEKDKSKVVDPTELKGLDELENILEDLFGTPAEPTVNMAKTPRNTKLIEKLSLDPDTLEAGSILYRRHCVHCHGLTGDGRGPTARWVHPHPRDYRRGQFKFTSVLMGESGGKPRREDLMRTLYEGIEGTSMPNFRVLPEEQRSEMVSYIIHLSIRGEVEYEVMRAISNQESGTVKKQATDALKDITQKWSAAQEPDARIMPHPYPKEYGEDPGDPPKESIRRGFGLFNGDAACIGCHTDYGRNAPFKYDAWGTLVRPANLTAGVYRGGRRPVDIYYRIHQGIKPSNMAGTSDAIAADAQKMWDLVNFVKALPYPAMLPDDVRDKVYGPGRK